MKRITLIIIVMAMLCLKLEAYNDLRVICPHDWWYQSSGHIETAIFEVVPLGKYAKCDITLEISTVDKYSFYDDLEINLNFELLPDAIITGMWLWINGMPEEAGIYEKWSAVNTYEGIVQRRTDPAILTKQYNGQYELKIYPLVSNSNRKVKMSVLIPVSYNNEGKMEVSLPVNILNTSASLIKSTKVRLYDVDNINETKVNLLRNSFQTVVEGFPVNDGGDSFEEFVVVDGGSREKISVCFPLKNQNSSYVVSYGELENSFLFDVNIAEELSDMRKKKFLILYDCNNSVLDSIEGPIEILKNTLHQKLDSNDLFQVMFWREESFQGYYNWLPGDSLSIAQTFNKKIIDFYEDRIDIGYALRDAINFLNDQENGGEIILFSNRQHLFSSLDKNYLISKIYNDQFYLKYPVHIIDMLDELRMEKYEKGVIDFDNEFYKVLAFESGGTNNRFSEDSLCVSKVKEIINNTFGFAYCDVQISMEAGITYDKHVISNEGPGIVHQTIFGKYQGNPPFRLFISAAIGDGTFYNVARLIDTSSVYSVDGDLNFLQQVWANHHIQELKSNIYDNSVIQEIIDVSKENKVLSEYTAFLALEPWMDPPEGESTDEVQNVVLNDDNEIGEHNIVLRCAPNPFITQTTIQYSIDQSADVEISIIDINGNLILRLVEDSIQKGEYSVKLDTGNIPSGIYFCQLVIGGKLVKTMRIVKS